MISEEVPAALDGERLDRIVALLADVSRADAAHLLAADAVRVDGSSATAGKIRLAEGQRIEIDAGAVSASPLPAADPTIDVSVRYEDDDVAVIDKAPGMVVHPGAGNPAGTLVNALLARFPEIAAVGQPERPGIVHRLDAGSSGLLVVARSESAYESLVAQFAAHTSDRRYDAVVWGHPEAEHGVVDAPIGRDPRDPVRMGVVAGGRDARTEFEVTTRYTVPATTARIECRLETGRTHQIRVHLASIGHPLVGDAVYGRGRPSLGLARPFLHAAVLSFTHPTTAERVTFTSPLAADLTAWVAAAE